MGRKHGGEAVKLKRHMERNSFASMKLSPWEVDSFQMALFGGGGGDMRTVFPPLMREHHW